MSDVRECGGCCDTPLKYPFWNKEHISSGSRPLAQSSSPTQKVLKDHLSFRTPHTSIDTVSRLYISFCPLCFLPFIPWMLIPRAFFTKSPACYNSSQSASWASQPRMEHFLEITTSNRGKCHYGCIWLQPFNLPWVWVNELCEARHRQSESKGSNCHLYM